MTLPSGHMKWHRHGVVLMALPALEGLNASGKIVGEGIQWHAPEEISLAKVTRN